jgi:hypothetical protein
MNNKVPHAASPGQCQNDRSACAVRIVRATRPLVALQVMGQGDPDIVAPPPTALESVSGWEGIRADHRSGDAVAATEGRAIATFKRRALTLPGAGPRAVAECEGALERTRCSCHGSTVTLAWWPPS